MYQPKCWRRIAAVPSIATVLVALASCEGEAPPSADSPLRPVSGRVLVGGRPAAGVIVRLHPLNHVLDPGVPHPFGETDADGVFQLGIEEGRDGAPAGQYLVTLEWPAAGGGGDRLGGTYAEPDGTGLTAVIEESTTALAPFELPSGGRASVQR